MVNLTGRETGGTMGKGKKRKEKTIRTTRVCAPASPGSTGAFASVPGFECDREGSDSRKTQAEDIRPAGLSARGMV